MSTLQQPSGLPRRIDALFLADEEAEIDGAVPLAALPRVAGSLAERRGEVQLHLRFCRDQHRRCLAIGELSSELQVVCQRCLEPMPLRMAFKVHWCLVRDDAEAQRLPRRLEPVLASMAGQLDLYGAIEDEILLGMPSEYTHQPQQCQLPQQYIHVSRKSAGRNRPFAKLAQQDNDRST